VRTTITLDEDVAAKLQSISRRTQGVFEVVMVALASISLLVGGIGILNIMLASILERPREKSASGAHSAHGGETSFDSF
jgi:putative ABC transport system permease protein